MNANNFYGKSIEDLKSALSMRKGYLITYRCQRSVLKGEQNYENYLQKVSG